MRSWRHLTWRVVVLAALAGLLPGALAGGCGAGASHYLREDVDLSFVRRVAVYPFFNLSQDMFAGQRVQSLFVTDLLDRGQVEVVDRGEMLAAIVELKLHPDTILSPEQVVALGKRLKADGVFFGTVEEYGLDRSSDDPTYVVAGNYQLCEAETGRTVWSSQVRSDGASLMRKLFGGGTAGIFDVARHNVQSALGTLF